MGRKINTFYYTGIILFDDGGMGCFKKEVKDKINEYIKSFLDDKNNLLEKGEKEK